MHSNAQNSGKIEACIQNRKKKKPIGLDDNMCELFKDSFMIDLLF